MRGEYPIREHRTLARAQRRSKLDLLRGVRRDPGELPSPQPGSTFVVEVDGYYKEVRPSHFRGDEDIILNAVGISVVDLTRDRRIDAVVTIPSRSGVADFQIRVSFSCTVRDPVAVVRDNVVDLHRRLADYIRRDPRLHDAGRDHDIHDVVRVREYVRARVNAWCLGHPPRVPGIDIELGDIEVLTPAQVRDGARDVWQELHRQRLDALKSDHSLTQARRLEEVTGRGPEAMEAVAIQHGDKTMGEATDRAFQDRDRAQQRALDILSLLADNNQLDRVPLDATKLYDAVVDGLVGSSARAEGGGNRAIEDRQRVEEGPPAGEQPSEIAAPAVGSRPTEPPQEF